MAYEIITGSSGFVGSHLFKHLKKIGKKPIPLYHKLLSRPIKLKKFLKEHQPFRLYHLSAYGNLHGQNDKHEIYKAIVINLLRLLDAIEGLELKGMIIAGSTSEYGYKKKPMKENQIVKPTSLYGAAKVAATVLAQAWVTQFDTPIVIYRPASITGVGEQEIHLIPTIIRSCLEKEPMQFIPEPTHDYINVKDVVSAITLLCEKAEKYKGEIFNVGTGIQWTNQQVLEMVEKYSKHKANIVGLKNLRVFEKSETWIANSDKLKKLGWEPKVEFPDSLKEMVNHAKNIKK